MTGNFDPLADIGVWICAHVPGLHQYSNPPDWVYNHLSLGPGMLAVALRLHWLCAYLFMLNGLIFVMGSAMGGGWRSLATKAPSDRNPRKFCKAVFYVDWIVDRKLIPPPTWERVASANRLGRRTSLQGRTPKFLASFRGPLIPQNRCDADLAVVTFS